MAFAEHIAQLWISERQRLNGAAGELDGEYESLHKSLSSHGLPGRKQEDWKYVPLSKYAKEQIYIPSGNETINLPTANQKENRFVIVDGFYRPKLNNLPEGEQIRYLGEGLSEQLQMLNQDEQVSNSIPRNIARLFTSQHQLNILVKDNVCLKHPIKILHINTAQSDFWINSYCSIQLGENAQASVYQEIHNSNDLLLNQVTDIGLGKNAQLLHSNLQDSKDDVVLNQTNVQISSGARYNSQIFALNGKLIRNELNVLLAEEHANCSVSGLYVPSGNQLFDNHLCINHQKPNGYSEQLYKGIMDDDSIAVFNGKILVQEAAQKTNAFQSNKNLLLTDRATINTKPQLEIFADDVKCSHGATSGQLEENEIFYLMSRGIPRQKAKHMLIQAFGEELIEQINEDWIAESIKSAFERKLVLE